MLVLSRQTNEEITIETPEGRIIGLTILEIKGGRVRLGFVADPSVIVDRNEVAEQKRQARGKRQ